MIAPRILETTNRTLRDAQSAVDRYNEHLFILDPTMHAFVDEIALLTPNKIALGELFRVLRDAGWEKFNEARDHVRTSPIASQYGVEYTFFRHPEKPWRLEVMRMVSGYSPLHGAIREPRGDELCVPVHASFKTADEEAYAYACGALESSAAYMLAQRCDSTYGRFSYWTKLDRFPTVPYLKPRVNLRDSGQEAIF